MGNPTLRSFVVPKEHVGGDVSCVTLMVEVLLYLSSLLTVESSEVYENSILGCPVL